MILNFKELNKIKYLMKYINNIYIININKKIKIRNKELKI